MTSRVSPLGSVQSPALSPANAGRSDCATSPTVMPSAPASGRFSCTSSSGFSPRVDSPTSTAPGTFATAPHRLLRESREHHWVGTAHLDLHFLHRAAKAAREHGHRRAGDVRELAPELRTQLILADVTLGLRHEPHVDERLIHPRRAERNRAADRGVRVRDLRMLARQLRHRFGAQPRVLEIAAARRLDDEIDLAAIADRNEAHTADRSLQREREHERPASQRSHGKPVVERPRDHSSCSHPPVCRTTC